MLTTTEQQAVNEADQVYGRDYATSHKLRLRAHRFGDGLLDIRTETGWHVALVGAGGRVSMAVGMGIYVADVATMVSSC